MSQYEWIKLFLRRMFLRVLGRTRSAPTFPWAMSPRCHPRFHLRILSECPVLPLKDRPTPRGPKPTKPRTDPAQKLENPSSQNSKIMKGISRNRRHLEWSVSVFCNFLFRFVYVIFACNVTVSSHHMCRPPRWSVLPSENILQRFCDHDPVRETCLVFSSCSCEDVQVSNPEMLFNNTSLLGAQFNQAH